MPSKREMRWGLIGAIVVAWSIVVWMIIDQFIWFPQGELVEQIHQMGIKVRVLSYIMMFVAVAGVILNTRAVYFMLRDKRERGDSCDRY